MPSLDLNRLNLNLVFYLEALLAEKSVSRAAKRCGITQSAMSHALRQLRDSIGDQLLVREGNTLHLTPRAERLAVAVQESLRVLRAALHDHAAFEPATASREFTILGSDTAALRLLPPLAEIVEREAPGVTLLWRAVDHAKYREMLYLGQADLCVGVNLAGHQSLRATALYYEDFVTLVADDGSPLPDTIERFAAREHVVVAPGTPGGVSVDDRLAERGTSRRIRIRLAYFMPAASIVARTRMIVSVPRSVGEYFAAFLPIRSIPMPVHKVRIPAEAVWHERFDGDAGLAWLRDAMARAAETLSPQSDAHDPER